MLNMTKLPPRQLMMGNQVQLLGSRGGQQTVVRGEGECNLDVTILQV